MINSEKVINREKKDEKFESENSSIEVIKNSKSLKVPSEKHLNVLNAEPKKYSDLFVTLYDETKSTNSIGRGPRYSILRAKNNSSQEENVYFDFAIIWDEDHDERIIGVLENLYEEKKLINYIIVGERKGGFTAILNPSKRRKNPDLLSEYLYAADGDMWCTCVSDLNDLGNGWLFQSSKEKVEEYVSSILNKWQLGEKILKVKKVIQQLPLNDDYESEFNNNNTNNNSPVVFPIKTNKQSQVIDKAESNHIKPDQSGSPKVSKLVEETDNKLLKLQLNDYSGKIVKKLNKKDGRKISMYGFPNKNQAQNKEIMWQKQTVTKFFKLGKPLQEGKQSYKIYQHITAQIEAKDKKTLCLDGCCRRSLIIALSKIITKYKSTPNLVFQLGETVIKFIPADENGTRRQIGNFKMEISNCYDIAYGEGCMTRLNRLLEPRWDQNTSNQSQRKQVFLKLIANKLQKFTPFKYTDLNKYGNIKLLDEETGDSSSKNMQNINFLNGLLFLVTTVEVLVRLYRTQEGHVFPYSDQNAIKSDSFPIAIAQARSLYLLLTGKITFIDFFGQSQKANYDSEQHRAYYGVATGKRTIDNIQMMLEKLLVINEKHNAFISNLEPWQDFKNDYLESNKEGYLLEGRSQMYFDLKCCYGSGSESDTESENYSSADDELEEVIEFKPKP